MKLVCSAAPLTGTAVANAGAKLVNCSNSAKYYTDIFYFTLNKWRKYYIFSLFGEIFNSQIFNSQLIVVLLHPKSKLVQTIMDDYHAENMIL